MKLSIYNFKAIQSIENFNITPIMVFCGTNSGGKTSFIQFLSLLKQTFENTSSNAPLVLNKPYVSLGRYKDITYDRDLSNEIEVTFELDETDIVRYARIIKRITKIVVTGLSVSVSFRYTSRLYVQNLSIIWRAKENENMWISFKRKRSYKYDVTTNSRAFFSQEFNDIRRNSVSVDLFYDTPQAFDMKVIFKKIFPTEHNNSEFDGRFSALANFYIENLLGKFFEGISYLGPLRDEPHFYYYNEEDAPIKIGNKGEYAAQILAEHASDVIIFQKVQEYNDGFIKYIEAQDTLENAVKYWICDVFDMARDLRVIKIEKGAMYKIEITNKAGIKTSISHVGFGISQLFPIVVEGLRLKKGEMLILEQPEIHLHPKVQSLLFDFVYSLSILGIKILIETHSDHFITRLRRRVAEDDTNLMVQKINLTFIEVENSQNIYKFLDLNNYGALTYWPSDFFDQHDKDLRAIVKAQGKKRIQSRKEAASECNL